MINPNVIIVIVVVATLMLAGCAAKRERQDAQANQTTVHKYQVHAEQGLAYMQAGMFGAAIVEFDEAIKQCSASFSRSGTRFYTSRTTAENLMYSLEATRTGQPAEVADLICSDAYYLRGFTALTTGRNRDAEGFLKKAIAMAPANAMYLSALGHIYQTRGDWLQAIDYFSKAEESAKTYSPDVLRTSEFLRAKRGIGFNLIQLGRLDEAEQKYLECVDINGRDRNSLNELEYIKILRSKASN